MDFSVPTDDLVFMIGGLTQQCITLEVFTDTIVEQGELLEIQIGGTIPIGVPGSTFVTFLDESREYTYTI